MPQRPIAHAQLLLGKRQCVVRMGQDLLSGQQTYRGGGAKNAVYLGEKLPDNFVAGTASRRVRGSARRARWSVLPAGARLPPGRGCGRQVARALWRPRNKSRKRMASSALPMMQSESRRQRRRSSTRARSTPRPSGPARDPRKVPAAQRPAGKPSRAREAGEGNNSEVDQSREQHHSGGHPVWLQAPKERSPGWVAGKLFAATFPT